VNNATLQELQNYSGGERELSALLRCVDRNWPVFLRALQAWAQTEAPTFQTLLKDQNTRSARPCSF
jgi:hypothetical protein